MNKPDIRFNGFNGEWETEKLSELCSLHARIGWQNLRTSEFLDRGEYLLITGTDFDDGRINLDNCHYVEKERYDQDKNIQISNGSILITKDGTLGKVAYVENLLKPATLNAGVFNVKVLRKDINRKFLFQYLKSPKLLDYVESRATGGTIKHLNQNILIDFPVIHGIETEQTKIGNLFSQIDSLISSTQKEHDKLVALKKCMLQKMFPKKGSLVPEIRFEGFTGNWEEKKISDLATIFIGLVTTMTKYYSNQGTLLIRNSDIKDNYFSFSDNPIYLNQEFADQNSSRKHKIGDVITVHTGDVGTSAVITEKEDGTIGFATIVTRPKTNLLDSMFLSIFLNSDAHKIWAVSVSTGDGRTNYNLGDYTQLLLKIPSLPEQQKIGSYFQNLDNLISKQSAELEKLKNVKKTLLSKMFV